MQERASEPSKTSVRQYRSRRRKSFLRRHKIALPAAGMLLYGGLMAAVASSGDFPGAIYDILHSWSSKPSLDTVAEPAPERTPRPLPELAVDSVDGRPLPDSAPQVSFLAAADGSVPTETLKSETPDDDNAPSTSPESADSPGEPGQETLPAQSPPGGAFAVSSGGTVGLLVQPFGASRTTPTFTIANVDPSTPAGGGTPPTSGPTSPIGTPSVPSVDGASPGDPSTGPQDPPPEETSNPGTNPPSNPGTNPTNPSSPTDNPQQNTGDPQQDPPTAGEPPVDTDPVDAPVVTVPEPASLTLVGPAVLGLWMLRRRRQRDRTG